jgi:glucose-6-phosphate isomerase
MRADQTAAWKKLAEYAKTFSSFNLRSEFERDAVRVAHFSQEAPGVFADLSKNLWDAKIEAQLFALAQQTGVMERRNRMFQGEAINTTENRAVMHWLLRQPAQGADLAALPKVVKSSLKNSCRQAHDRRSEHWHRRL